MSKNKRFIKGGMWLSIGYGLSALFSFLRNIVLARLVSIEDYGIASLFAITMAIIEMLSNIAIDKLLIQTKDEQLEQLQAVGQMFQFFRGLSSGLLIYILAKPIAVFFQVPEAVNSFEWFALVPIVRGLAHLDIQVFQRRLEFAPVALSSLIPHIVSLIALVILGRWLGDYTVIVWVILIQNCCYVLLTFYYAEKKYRWSYDPVLFNRMISFGWPLLANGFLMFIIMQGDKAVVGAFFSTRELGLYSAAFALTLAPTLVITKLITSLYLPLLSNSQNNEEVFCSQYRFTMQTCYFFCLSYGLVIIYFGQELLIFLFGKAFSEASTFVVFLGLMHCIRIIKSGTILVSMSKGETKNAFLSNIVRAVTFSLLLIFVIFSRMHSKDVAMLGLIGEIFSLIASIYLLDSRVSKFDKNLALQLCILVLIFIVNLFLAYLTDSYLDSYVNDLIFFIFIVFSMTFYLNFYLGDIKQKTLQVIYKLGKK